MLDFGKHNGSWDIAVNGLGIDAVVSDIANTTLKASDIGKHIPLVAEQTQGEVITFASAAAAKMGEGGSVVLMEGRAPTLAHVRTPYRFELIMSETEVIGQRRAAQRLMASAAAKLANVPAATEPVVAAALLSCLAETK